MKSTDDITVTLTFRLLSKQDVARMLGCTTRTIDRLMAANAIPFISLPTGTSGGHKIKFDPAEIQVWLNGRRRGAPIAERSTLVAESDCLIAEGA